MRGKAVTKKEIGKMIYLRQTGHSLPEIRKIMSRGNATVFRYVGKVNVLPEYVDILKSKQGGSKARSCRDWGLSQENAKKLLNPISSKDRLLILIALYWGEGTKSELNIINSDPELLRIFIECLAEIGVTREMLRVTLRVYEDMPVVEIRSHWAHVLNIPEESISGVNILKGKKDGKLKYGMCRIRVTRGGQYFKLIMSMIELIKSKV